MSDSQLLMVIGISTAAMGVALCVIAGCAIVATRNIRDLLARADALLALWEPVAGEVSRAVKGFSEQSGELISRLSALAANLQEQADRVDGAIEEVASAVRRTTQDVESTARKTLRQFEELTDALDQAVRAPVIKLRALGEAIGAMLRQFKRGKRPDPDRIPNEEERFI